MNKKAFSLTALAAGLMFSMAAQAANVRIGVTIYKV